MADLEKFIKDFGFRSVNVKRERPRVLYTYGTYGAPNTASYYNYEDEVVEMEINKRELENLANVYYRSEHFLGKERHENYLRRKHPAIADAYSKYQMLLELYR
jgi:hypothetical protein